VNCFLAGTRYEHSSSECDGAHVPPAELTLPITPGCCRARRTVLARGGASGEAMQEVSAMKNALNVPGNGHVAVCSRVNVSSGSGRRV
jgi:hypothetical protein